MPELDWSRWPHFKPAELACKCGCGAVAMDPDFMDELEWARVDAGVPFVVTSGFRCAAHDLAVGTSSAAGAGPHTTGRAADIVLPAGAGGFAILAAAVRAGLLGFGLRGKGRPAGRYIHLDDIEPRVWTY